MQNVLAEYTCLTSYRFSSTFLLRKSGFRILLPPHVESLDEQAVRAHEAYKRKDDDLDRHIYLEMTPMVYTPVVALTCQQFSHSFPPAAIRAEHFQPSDTHTVCPWKGTASYYDVVVNGEVNKDAAWFYPETKDAAKNIENCVAFWKGVKVSE